MFKARKIVMVISLALIIVMPMLIAAAPAQEEEPPAVDEGEPDAVGLLTEFLDPFFDILVYAVALAIFLFGTVQGTQIAKIFFPKSTNADGWWYKTRPYVIRGVSLFFSVWAMTGLNFDAFAILTSINENFEVAPIFGQLISGFALSFGSNKYYDKYEDE